MDSPWIPLASAHTYTHVYGYPHVQEPTGACSYPLHTRVWAPTPTRTHRSMFIPAPTSKQKHNKKGEIFGLSFPTLMGKWRRRQDWGPELSAWVHTKPQTRDLRKPSPVSSVVGTVLIFVGWFVWSVSTLGVWGVVSSHVTSAVSGFLVETLWAFIFIGFELTRVLHRISACRYQTNLELIVRFTRRLGTRGTCRWWTC